MTDGPLPYSPEAASSLPSSSASFRSSRDKTKIRLFRMRPLLVSLGVATIITARGFLQIRGLVVDSLRMAAVGSESTLGEEAHDWQTISANSSSNSNNTSDGGSNNRTADVCIASKTEEEVQWTGFHDFEAILPLDQVVHGSRKAADADKAICSFNVKGGGLLLAHGMQQLYRCFSYWMLPENAQKQKVLLGLKKYEDTPFHVGVVAAFRDIWNISVHAAHPEMGALPSVRALVNERYERKRGGGYAVHQPTDMPLFRDSIFRHYALDKNEHLGGCRSNTNLQTRKSTPVVGILNRRGRRQLLNHAALQDRLEQELNVKVQHFYMEGKTFVEQVGNISQVDLLLTPHGAQLVSLPFMPSPCSSVLEFFPSGYWMPYFFGTLAQASGIKHAHFYTGMNLTEEYAESRKSVQLREDARNRNLCVDVDKTVAAVRTMVQEWQTCCNRAH